MGALTSKTFPFELREWDVEYFYSIDPTDIFGSNTKIYIKEDQVIQIQPDYNFLNPEEIWLTDKGRQFFDSIFNDHKLEKMSHFNFSFIVIATKIVEIIYYFDFFNSKYKKEIKKFIIVFENVGLEILSFLTIIQNNFSFLKLKKIEKHKIFNNLESNFQLNLITNKIKLNLSTFCLIISNNPRYEGHHVNLNLKKRFSNGNFECYVIGSLINLTFFTFFLGSSIKTFINVIQGKHLICKKLKLKKKPSLILNTNFFKRDDNFTYLNILQILQQSKVLSTNWSGINILNYNLSENGINSTLKFKILQFKDLLNFSSLYFLNLGANNIFELKKLINNKLLCYYSKDNKINNNNKLPEFLIINQTQPFFDKLNYLDIIKDNYFFIPNSMIYNNENTFINAKGGFCTTTKLISIEKNMQATLSKFSAGKIQNNWSFLRKIVEYLNNKKLLFCFNVKNNNILFPNFESLFLFKNFMNFNFYATIKLTKLNFYLQKQTKPFTSLNFKFKCKTIKMYYTKLNYWLNDFFIGGRDEYSYNSKVLNFCSSIVKKENTLFF